VVDVKRQEALLNEYKGNIFEYLVCIEISKIFNKEIHFISALPLDLQVILEQQESFLRNYYPYLLIELPKLAAKAATEFVKKEKLKSIDRVLLAGKKLATTQDSNFKEADILVYKSSDSYLPISLKLSKMNAFVNTKSAGVRTIFDKYFDQFEDVSLQEDFNHFVDIEYESLAIKLHDILDIPYTNLFENWERLEKPVLPGQLEGQCHVDLIDYYKKVNKYLFKTFSDLLEKDKSKFLDGVLRLMGFSNSEMIQLTAFYLLKNEEFVKTKVDVSYLKDIYTSEMFHIEMKHNPTNFEVKLNDSILQVRIKPMNKFTSKSYKVNCSIKKT
jgi:hypothetical protein